MAMQQDVSQADRGQQIAVWQAQIKESPGARSAQAGEAARANREKAVAAMRENDGEGDQAARRSPPGAGGRLEGHAGNVAEAHSRRLQKAWAEALGRFG